MNVDPGEERSAPRRTQPGPATSSAPSAAPCEPGALRVNKEGCPCCRRADGASWRALPGDAAGSDAPSPEEPPVSPRPALHRSIGLLHATALVAGIIIGASIFVQRAEIMREVPSVAGMLAVWVTAGLLAVAGALMCAELASAMPRTGGIYVFLRETLSPALAFLWGWAMFWSMHSGIVAAIAVVFARYVAYFVPLGDAGIRAAAIAAVLLVSAVNYAGVQHGSRLQTAFTVVKVLAILLMILAGFTLGSGAPEPAGAAGDAPGGATAAGFVRALIAGLFAFGGWHMVTYAAGETRDPERTIPRALAIGMAVV